MLFLLFLVLHSSHLDANIIAQKRKNREPASFLHFTPHSSREIEETQVDLMKTPKAVLKYADRIFSDCGSFEIPSNQELADILCSQ
jgi:hypothetical protein